MRYQQSVAARQHRTAIEFRQTLFGLQLLNIGVVAGAGVLVWAITTIWPSLFPYEYLSFSTSFAVLAHFWPLLVYGFVLSLAGLVVDGVSSSQYDERLLGWKLLTGWTAALWEEVGFRWLFICFGMISIMVVNWLFGTVLGWVLVVFFLVCVIRMLSEDNYIGALACVGMMVLSALFALQADPVYWFYEMVIMPLLNFASFGLYHNIVNPTLYPPVLVMGGILVNAKFRDGHKYQGIVGFINSWILGFVFLYAMFTYGLMTAIVLHGLWNSYVAFKQYFFGKASRLLSSCGYI